jgi:hypothetical protein
VVAEITKAIRHKQTANPRTVLGFYASIIGILLTGSVSVVISLAATHSVTWLIPWIFGSSFVTSLIIMGGIFYLNLKHPANLMLGQITGTEYAEIHRLTILGNDTEGERAVSIQVPNFNKITTVESEMVDSTTETSFGLTMKSDDQEGDNA